MSPPPADWQVGRRNCALRPGDDGELEIYVRRGLENDLTEAQIAEALAHLGFYGGWPKAAKALGVLKRTIGK